MPATTYVPPLGCTLDEIDTPALCVDLDVMEANIRKMSALCAQHRVNWRPHAKGHKSPAIARLQQKAGAIGVTCAKLGEAEVMAAGGIDGILVANQIVGQPKLARLVALRHEADPIVAVDDLVQVEQLDDAARRADVTLSLIIEVDIGLRRAGVEPGEATVNLARHVANRPALVLTGIMGYEGHLLTVEDQAEKERRIREAMACLVETKHQVERAGIPCPIVSAAGTGSCLFTMRCSGITELQAGGLIFMDAYYRRRCMVAEFDFALKLLTTVVSRPARDRAIIDAGRKSQNAEVEKPFVHGREDIHVARLSAEHGWLELDPSAQDLRIGDRLELIPGYGDFTTVLHDELYGVRSGRLEVIWPILARGKIR